MSLCSRCGAILESDHSPGSFTGECPTCGLGYSGTSLVLTGEKSSTPRQGRGDRRRAQSVEKEHDARRGDAVTRCSFPVYGLGTNWTGRRWLGGWGGSGANIDHLDLAHGDAYDPDAPLVRVETRRTSAEQEPDINTFAPLVKHSMACSLAEHLWHETGDYLDATPSTFQSEDPTGEWDAIILEVDGEPRAFSSLRVGAHWVALGEVSDAVLGLQARNLGSAEITLVTITDPLIYLEDDGRPR